MRFRPARLYTWIASIGLLLQGSTTLAARLIPAIDQAFPALLRETQMIPSHSLVHIVSALSGIVALGFLDDRGPRLFAFIFGLFYVALSIAGYYSGQPLGIGLQPFDHSFHAVLGGAGLLAALIEFAWVRVFDREDEETAESSAPTPNLRVNLPLRIWIMVEVIFGVMSLLTISLTPNNTAQHFAWPIKAETTAAVLGGFYIAAASFFVLAMFAKRWENIRVFVPASILFSSAELIATFLHLDKFSVGTTPFNVWLISYILPPPLFLGFYIWHQRKAVPIPKPGDETLWEPELLVMKVLGAVLVFLALVVFMLPNLLVTVAPIEFTPLTARAFSGWVLALGMLLLLAAHENDRTRVRLISPFFVLLLPAIAIEVARFPAQLDWTNPLIYVAVALLAVVFFIGLDLIRGSWRKTLR